VCESQLAIGQGEHDGLTLGSVIGGLPRICWSRDSRQLRRRVCVQGRAANLQIWRLRGRGINMKGTPMYRRRKRRTARSPLAARASACGRSFWRRLRRIKPPAEIGCANPSGINVNPNSI